MPWYRAFLLDICHSSPPLLSYLTRARGTELISPEDLLASCKLLASLHLGMRLRRFASGVLVIEAGE